MPKKWKFWIDRGGTFTDIVYSKSDQSLHTHKLLSVDPQNYKDAAIHGIKSILQSHGNIPLNSQHVEHVKMGTTVATNALLEKKGARTALLTTRGFRDALRIGYQNRPDIFALNVELPEMLYEEVVEVDERIDARGEILKPLEQESIQKKLEVLKSQGIESISVCLMNSYINPSHEIQIENLLSGFDFNFHCVSHRVSPLIKFIPRGDTALINAYLSPILFQYLNMVREEINDVSLLFMQSSAGLIDAENFEGKDSILSGPAGGIIGMIETAKIIGEDKVIGFDMGGTSTDVSLSNGDIDRVLETEIAGVRLQVPMVNIHTIAAGGSSILNYDEQTIKVGPESAGSHPGPVSYKKGGELTVTDVNVVLGRLQPEFFPKVFGQNANEALGKKEAEEKFKEFTRDINQNQNSSKTEIELAQGFLDVAVDNMANAIQKISIEKGINPADYTLSCFGGAGGQHACLVAGKLGMKKIMIHPFAGVLSALGMGLAQKRIVRSKNISSTFSKTLFDTLNSKIQDLKNNFHDSRDDDFWDVFCYLRYEGTETKFKIRYSDQQIMQEDLNEEFFKVFGYRQNRNIMIDILEVERVSPNNVSLNMGSYFQEGDSLLGEYVVCFHDKEIKTPFYKRECLKIDDGVEGPAVIVEQSGTTVLEPGWKAQVDSNHNLILKSESKQSSEKIQKNDSVQLQIFSNKFMSIAEQMGFVLQKTSASVNIKERLDFSCAIFNNKGELVANAPHVPVHLGSMQKSIEYIIQANDNIQNGDVFLLNSPYHGGTHLPDITVITPVFIDYSKAYFFVASRGHHADVGGISPGSMPAFSQHIDEEGILFDNFKLVDQGEFQGEELKSKLLSGKYPARNIEENVQDIKAQIAANNKGVVELVSLVKQYSFNLVDHYMNNLLDYGEQEVDKVINDFSESFYSCEMDNGSRIELNIRRNSEKNKLTFDFSGTSQASASNNNAPLAITHAAVLYVLRTLVNKPIPLNAGCLRPVEIVVPEGCLLNPTYPSAVVSGNVETSQQIVDCIYGALGILANSQGTMNNLSFGNDHIQYYETIAGGMGAGNGFHGQSAIQVHMTNSRLTDPEILEQRFPVMLDEFSIRQNSGGKGKWNGGEGVYRKITAVKSNSDKENNEPLLFSVLSNRRNQSPKGLNGGWPAEPGLNIKVDKAGNEITLKPSDSVILEPGESIIIQTPGGGGFGESENSN